MKVFAQNAIGILSGEELLFSDFDTDGPMWKGNGDRDVRLKVTFATPYSAAPAVTVNMSMLDMAHDTNIRADLTAENVTQLGFEIVFRTWGNSRIARVRAAWQAIGPVLTDEGWEDA